MRSKNLTTLDFWLFRLILPLCFAYGAYNWRQSHFRIIDLERQVHHQSNQIADINRRLNRIDNTTP